MLAPNHSVFYRPDAPHATQPSQSTEGIKHACNNFLQFIEQTST